MRKRAENSPLMWLKVAFVSVVLFAGAATAIMSFHTDGQIPKIFERVYQMFYGVQVTNPPIIVIPYSIGLALGIIVFYNHFMGRKITVDPTPIEVEIETYEKEVTEAMVELMEKREEMQNA
jgi:stage V sporulation protein AA